MGRCGVSPLEMGSEDRIMNGVRGLAEVREEDNVFEFLS